MEMSCFSDTLYAITQFANTLERYLQTAEEFFSPTLLKIISDSFEWKNQAKIWLSLENTVSTGISDRSKPSHLLRFYYCWVSLDTLKDHEMPRYGYSTRQSGPPPRDHITEYRPAICRGNAMGNTNLWRFFMPCRGYAKLYEYGWEIPCFFACGRRKRGRPYPFPYGRPGGDMGA